MTKDSNLDVTLQKHAKVFHGMGKLNIDKDHTPKVEPQRRIPFHIWQDVQSALEELLNQDIIEWFPEDPINTMGITYCRSALEKWRS